MSGASDKTEPKPGRQAPGGFSRAVGRIAEDLFTLEVITIVQDHIPATKMPPPEQALHDIAHMYEQKLSAMHVGPTTEAVAAKKNGSMPAFDTMMERAMGMMQEMEPAGQGQPAAATTMARGMSESGDMAVLKRIADCSHDLMKLSQKMESMMAAPGGSVEAAEMLLTPEEIMRLHLIWHMGVEEVAMKTTIYVTGDVITRVRPELLGESGRALVDIHHSAIRTAVDFWKTLADVLGSLLGSLGQFLSPGRGRVS